MRTARTPKSPVVSMLMHNNSFRYREDEQISACLGSRSPGFLQHHNVAMNGLPLVGAQHTLIEAYLA
jgi:hypothetical protein